MSVIVGIQARMGSTRLPGKSLMDICGKTMLERVYDACDGPWERFVLTSTASADDELADLCDLRGVRYRRGSLPDVLLRYVDLASYFKPQCLVRVCADAPFIESEWISDAINVVVRRHMPVFISGALHAGHWTHWMQAYEWCKENDREHAGHDWFRENSLWLERVPNEYMTVNTQEDLEEARRRWPTRSR